MSRIPNNLLPIAQMLVDKLDDNELGQLTELLDDYPAEFADVLAQLATVRLVRTPDGEQ